MSTRASTTVGTVDDDPGPQPRRATTEWGPLRVLAGEWEGDRGDDHAFSHAAGRVVRTRYRERASFVPFGPVRNGRQRLHGLDYRTAMWRGDDPDPFHREVGYWLWDRDTGEVLRCFVVPRGITVLAGGTATADATVLELSADLGEGRHAIAENRYLARHARSLAYRATIRVPSDDTWSYEEVTTLEMAGLPEPFAHADRNTLHRIR